MSLPRSPLAPPCFPNLPQIGGVSYAACAAGVRYRERLDVALIALTAGTQVAGVFTRSATRSAAVLDCQEKLGVAGEGGAAIVVNAGNANAFTGGSGQNAVRAITEAVASRLGIDERRVFSASTGVIGEKLPHERITGALEQLAEGLTPSGVAQAAEAICTTDTFPKGAGREVEINGTMVRIAGIAKGSGMIAPDMATMLVYIFTDAVCAQAPLQEMLARLCNRTFNCITVDGDTSTSDTLLLAATGASGVDVAGEAAFEAALEEVMLDLAHQVVRDGEGASKFLTVRVEGAASDEDARRHGFSIANSPLVKTAIAGEDPNWGRVVMAIGKSGAAAERDLLSIWFGPHLVAEKGWVAESYREETGAAYMKGSALEIRCDLGLGSGQATVWTCDLTHGYISINADYRS